MQAEGDWEMEEKKGLCYGEDCWSVLQTAEGWFALFSLTEVIAAIKTSAELCQQVKSYSACEKGLCSLVSFFFLPHLFFFF